MSKAFRFPSVMGSNPARTRGFTLIEVMITVVIVGILAAVAYPSYTEYVARGHRTQLKTQLQAAQHWMERRYSERYYYGQASGNDVSPTAFGDQPFVSSPPAGEGSARYTLSVTVADNGQSYVVTAQRAGTMSSDKCGDPTVDNHGAKGIADNSLDGGPYEGDDAKALTECWR